MDRKTENLLYNINKMLFENENPFEDDDEALEFANRMKQAGVQFKDTAQNYGNKVADTTKDLWNQASTSMGNKIDDVKEWWNIKNRDAADAQNERSMSAYNQRLKDQELADIKARDAADAANEKSLDDYMNKRYAAGIDTANSVGKSIKDWEHARQLERQNNINKISDVIDRTSSDQWKRNIYNMGKYKKPDGTVGDEYNDQANASNLLRDGFGHVANKVGTGQPGDPLLKSQPENGVLDWIQNHKLETGLAAGVPLALTGGYLAYRKLKNRNK